MPSTLKAHNSFEGSSQGIPALGDTLSLSAPAKTFLLGEYLALLGGPALLVATGPRFRLQVGGGSTAFHPDSPAGRWLKKYPDALASEVGFHDPFEGAGGLGASSAQFVLLECLRTRNGNNWQSVWQSYRDLTREGANVPPSGADVVCQYLGGVTWFHADRGEAERLEWNFAGLDFTLVKTPHKLPTHEHLARVDLENIAKNKSIMSQIVHNARHALISRDETELLCQFHAYNKILSALDLILPDTQALQQRLQAQNGVWTSRGCGAMGADVVCVLHDRSATESVHGWLKSQDLKILATSQDISEGVQHE